MDIAVKEATTGLEEYTTDFKIKVLPFLDNVLEWLKEGRTQYSIAEQLGIHYNTFAVYREKYNVIRELYARATRERNCLVMNAMFSKATGITQKIEQQKITKDGIAVDFTETIYVAPDVNAADLFLRNNDPEYKQAKQLESGQNITVNFQLPEAKAKVEQLLTEREKLKAVDITAFEVYEAE